MLVEKPTIERVEIKAALGLTLPKTQIVSRLGVASRNHDIVRDSQNLLPTVPVCLRRTVVQAVSLAIEANLVRDVQTRKLIFQ